ncbi:OrNVorf005-like [Cotesia congregata filamentous virus 1]|uniref:OrNVorf005-like n=1 Tax=Cotesia congregata filamentous virus 1 TaxID=3064291 RepID=A0ABC8QJN9_9VIRU|nr:OrNVorf005-like [Cotesia congregata filamentous virus 1]
MVLSSISYIVDMDGITRNSVFFPTEIGVYNVLSGQILVYRFALPFTMANLSFKDRRTANYVLKNILFYKNKQLPHLRSLTFEEYWDSVAWVISERIQPHDTVVAYKGGTVERKLFRTFAPNVQLVNLENYGCPTFKQLYTFGPRLDVHSCDRHDETVYDSTPPHCPGVEVAYYARWLNESLL